MALNPQRDAFDRAGSRAFHAPSPFKAEADRALAGFRARRAELVRKVRRGDLTLKVAREQAAEAAGQIKTELLRQAEKFETAPRAFLDRVIEASEARKKAAENRSLEGLQRETNRLLKRLIVEQQLQARAAEFEAKAHERPKLGGTPAPTLGSLLAFHESAKISGDDAAMEWGRRALEGMRSRTTDPSELRRIDLACDRPDQVNLRLVEAYVESLENADPSSLETFATEARSSKDANACVAAFLLAKKAEEGMRLRWVRQVLLDVRDYPDTAVETLRSLESVSRTECIEAAKAQAEYSAAELDLEAGLADLSPPTPSELDREQRVRSKPAAALGEPIGLSLERRGYLDDEDPLEFAGEIGLEPSWGPDGE